MWEYPCSPRCIPNSTKSNQGVAVGGRKWFSKCKFRHVLCQFRQGGCIGDFLRVSLALIQGQYKQTPVGAKGTIWAAKDDEIFTFSAMGRSKTSKAHKPKVPCLNNLLNIFSFNYWNWVYTVTKASFRFWSRMIDHWILIINSLFCIHQELTKQRSSNGIYKNYDFDLRHDQTSKWWKDRIWRGEEPRGRMLLQ